MSKAAKLPFWRTAYDAHVITIDNFLTMLRVAWVWVLLLAAIDAGIHWILWPWEQAASAEGKIGSISLLLLSTFCWTLFGACVAVPWHRFVLNSDVVTAAGVFPLAGDLVRYVGWALLFALFMVGPFLALYWFDTNAMDSVDEPAGDLNELTGDDAGPSGWFCLICAGAILVPFAVLAYIPVRLSLVLPAIALARRDFGAADSWRATRSNFWRLYLGYLLTFAAPLVMIAFQLSLTGIDEVRTRETAVRDALVADTFLFLAGMFTVTFMSLSYRHLVQDPATNRNE